MPSALTRDFGEVHYEASAEWSFPQGLPGFEDRNHFIIIEPAAFSPIVFLQSLQAPELCFLAVSVWVADPAYQVGMTSSDLETLALSRQPKETDKTRCLAILSSGGEAFTANLLAPVVMNPQTHTALQAVRTDARYSYCHPLSLEALPCL